MKSRSSDIFLALCLFTSAVLADIKAEASDTDAPKTRPAVHHVQPTDQQRDIDALRAEVQRLRAEAERCLLTRK